MKLNTREWGSGDRIALLVHGIMSDSLGGLELLLAAEELRPAKAVYADPAWRVDRLEDDFDPTLFVEIADWATAESIAATNPRWEPGDVAVEVETFAVWDRQTALEGWI